MGAAHSSMIDRRAPPQNASSFSDKSPLRRCREAKNFGDGFGSLRAGDAGENVYRFAGTACAGQIHVKPGSVAEAGFGSFRCLGPRKGADAYQLIVRSCLCGKKLVHALLRQPEVKHGQAQE